MAVDDLAEILVEGPREVLLARRPVAGGHRGARVGEAAGGRPRRRTLASGEGGFPARRGAAGTGYGTQTMGLEMVVSKMSLPAAADPGRAPVV